MLGSHGLWRKQHPYDESVCVPFLLRGPGLLPGTANVPVNAPDVMPTLLSLCGVPIPHAVQGDDLSAALKGERKMRDHAALLALYMPFHELRKPAGREYRGIRTDRYTYIRDLKGPWLLFDNQDDPFQTRNLVPDASHKRILRDSDEELSQKLGRLGDEFLPGEEYFHRYKIRLDENGDTWYER
jgi:arylsulfatase A-like enzyme